MNLQDVLCLTGLFTIIVSNAGVWYALIRLRELLDDYGTENIDALAASKASVEDLNTRMAQIQKSRFAYMGTRNKEK